MLEVPSLPIANLGSVFPPVSTAPGIVLSLFFTLSWGFGCVFLLAAVLWDDVAFFPGTLFHSFVHGDGADTGANASEEAARKPHHAEEQHAAV